MKILSFHQCYSYKNIHIISWFTPRLVEKIEPQFKWCKDIVNLSNYINLKSLKSSKKTVEIIFVMYFLQRNSSFLKSNFNTPTFHLICPWHCAWWSCKTNLIASNLIWNISECCQECIVCRIFSSVYDASPSRSWCKWVEVPFEKTHVSRHRKWFFHDHTSYIVHGALNYDTIEKNCHPVGQLIFLD